MNRASMFRSGVSSETGLADTPPAAQGGARGERVSRKRPGEQIGKLGPRRVFLRDDTFYIANTPEGRMLGALVTGRNCKPGRTAFIEIPISECDQLAELAQLLTTMSRQIIPAHAEVDARLKELGIHEPTRGELARMDGVTLALIDYHWKDIQAKHHSINSARGVLISRLKSGDPMPAEESTSERWFQVHEDYRIEDHHRRAGRLVRISPDGLHVLSFDGLLEHFNERELYEIEPHMVKWVNDSYADLIDW